MNIFSKDMVSEESELEQEEEVQEELSESNSSSDDELNLLYARYYMRLKQTQRTYQKVAGF